MQSPAEKHLVGQLSTFLKEQKGDSPALILNVGAGRSLSIEKQLSQLGCQYISDRVDIEDCGVVSPVVGTCWVCSVEDMRPIGSGRYQAAFANFVLEHVQDLQKASREISRVLGPSGIFTASVPNTVAPEFVVARLTPLWFHKVARRTDAWETSYSYRGIPELIEVFEGSGFITQEVRYWPGLEGYLRQYPAIGILGQIYDRIVSASKIRNLMGQVCIVLKKAP